MEAKSISNENGNGNYSKCMSYTFRSRFFANAFSFRFKNFNSIQLNNKNLLANQSFGRFGDLDVCTINFCSLNIGNI